MPILDFARQYVQIRGDVLSALERVCDGQRFILGEEVGRFEDAAAQACSAPGTHLYGIGCASGTDALWLALASKGIGTGDAVVTTPFSFFATVSSILRVGAQPLLADIDPRTYNLSAAATETLLRDGSGRHCRSAPIAAIMPVHLYGQCADWDAFSMLQKDFDVALLEDAAQAFGARWTGRPAGSLGNMAAFSFYPTKNLSAYGDAGLVTTPDEELAERARVLRAHGMRRRYYHEEVGWNSRLDTLQAAVLLVKLAYIDRWNQQRRELAQSYGELFQKAGLADRGTYPEQGIILPYVDPRGTHVFHQYVVRVRRRDALRAFLTEKHVGSEIYYPVPLHMQAALRGLGYAQGDFPESERAAAEVLALPMFPELTRPEQEQVVAMIAEFLS
ncbi:MAG TPA: DegT/DnrJ/EryC1/StrS family aminotransferase [Acidobacteriaceae bacterium]|nr:DegT/DnrJ/EryC1/StrS family aminotransferase [Acidobacteriaceae bacterium]